MTITIGNASNMTINAAMTGYYSIVASSGASITSPSIVYYMPQPQQGVGQWQNLLPVPGTVTQQRTLSPLEFNKYINGSDLLEEFIAFLDTQKVKQHEVMGLPVELFIKWLIIRACEQDGEEPNVTLTLPTRQHAVHCLGCGKFMTPKLRPQLHNERCAGYYFRRQKEQVLA